MSFTMAQVVDKARDPLVDADGARWAPSDLLAFAIDGLITIRSARPDLFLGAWTTDFTTLAMSDRFPLADPYALAVADYVTGRANLRDEDDASATRAEAFLKMALARIA